MKTHPAYSYGRRAVLKAAICAATLITAGTALAAESAWPSGSVQLVVPAKPGGGTDAVSRAIATSLQDIIGAPVVVVNSPSGAGAVAAEQVRTAKPDGLTLLFYHSALLTTYYTGGYDHSPTEEFTTIASLPVAGSFALAVNASSPYKTVEELVQATKDNPDKMTIGVQLLGGSHFMAGLIKMDSGAEFRIVEAGGDADKIVALQGNQVDISIINTPAALQYVKSGDFRILGTIAGTPGRDPTAPDYPSMNELGYKDVVYGTDFLVLGPPNMDEAMSEKINAAFAKALDSQVTKDMLAKMKLPVGSVDLAESRKRIQEADAKVKATAELLGLKK